MVDEDFEWAGGRISDEIQFSPRLHYQDPTPKGVFLAALHRSLNTDTLANLEPGRIAEIIEVFDDLSNSWRSRVYNRKHRKSQLRLTLTKEDRTLLTELSEKQGLTKQKEAILAALAELKALKTDHQELSERVTNLQERQQQLEKDLKKEREKSAELESKNNSLHQNLEFVKGNQKDLEVDPVHKELHELMSTGDSDH